MRCLFVSFSLIFTSLKSFHSTISVLFQFQSSSEFLNCFCCYFRRSYFPTLFDLLFVLKLFLFLLLLTFTDRYLQIKEKTANYNNRLQFEFNPIWFKLTLIRISWMWKNISLEFGNQWNARNGSILLNCCVLSDQTQKWPNFYTTQRKYIHTHIRMSNTCSFTQTLRTGILMKRQRM